MTWEVVASALRLSYLLRVPLFTLVILGSFGPVSLGINLLANLLDQAGNQWNLFLVSFTAFMLAFTAITTLNLILYYGNLRFDVACRNRMALRAMDLVFRRAGGWGIELGF